MTTAIWALLASVVGGIIGAGVKFTFEDLLRPKVGWRRDSQHIVSRFTTPLLRSAETLERRINNLVRNEDARWYQTDEYYRLSTLYAFGEYFGWMRAIERRFGFIPVEAMRHGRVFTTRLYGIVRALSSFAYFRGYQAAEVEASAVPRLMLTAIGEAMTATDHESVMEFTEFVTRYVNDPQFARWFAELDQFLRRTHPDDPLTWGSSSRRLNCRTACVARLPRSEGARCHPPSSRQSGSTRHPWTVCPVGKGPCGMGSNSGCLRSDHGHGCHITLGGAQWALTRVSDGAADPCCTVLQGRLSPVSGPLESAGGAGGLTQFRSGQTVST